MELFLSRQNDQIAPVLDTCGWHCFVTPLSGHAHYGIALFALSVDEAARGVQSEFNVWYLDDATMIANL